MIRHRTRRWGWAKVASVILVGAAAAGCSSPDATVRGKVIEGKTSLIGAIPGNDPRLTGPGIEGVTITGKMDASRGGATAFTGTSGPEGVIEIKASQLRAFSTEVDVTATRDGYLPARQVLVIPSQGRQMLIVLRRAGGAPPP